MTYRGRDVIDVGSTRVGQTYVLGAMVPLNNPNWKGPWDCAEFTSWCAYQAYGLIFGAGGVKDVKKAQPYSGAWYTEAKKNARVISVADALNIPGAYLVKAPPGGGKVGHVAISIGDGDRTLEARGKAYGVGIFGKAASRPWSIGCLLPGVEYDSEPSILVPAEIKTAVDLPKDYLALRQPHLKGLPVVALQRALLSKGVNPGPVDGDFGAMTHAAVVSFQAEKGLEVDGIVGPLTAAALGLSIPIAPAAADTAAWSKSTTPAVVAPLKLAAAGTGPVDLVETIGLKGGAYHATTGSGFTFLVGSSTSYTDDMHRTGLFQGKKAIADSIEKFGVYQPGDYEEIDRQWAHFMLPTFKAEGGRYATLNTYDRAAFTFGAPQLATHTPDLNFVIYLRALLSLPNADKHFPELVIAADSKGKERVHLRDGSALVNLEEVVEVTRPNNVVEKQLARLMAYLNPSPTKIDAAELSAAARLMNWLRQDVRAKQLQLEVFVEHTQKNLARAKSKVPAFTGDDWRTALWIMDILHQGRGTFAEMKNAFASGDPLDRLSLIGAVKYSERVKTVRKEIAALEASGVLDGFKV